MKYEKGDTMRDIYLVNCCRTAVGSMGGTLKDTPVDRCVELTRPADGALRQSVKASCSVPGGCRVPSTVDVTYSLDAGSRALRVELKIDWQEQGGETVPVLTWKTPWTR